MLALRTLRASFLCSRVLRSALHAFRTPSTDMMSDDSLMKSVGCNGSRRNSTSVTGERCCNPLLQPRLICGGRDGQKKASSLASTHSALCTYRQGTRPSPPCLLAVLPNEKQERRTDVNRARCSKTKDAGSGDAGRPETRRSSMSARAHSVRPARAPRRPRPRTRPRGRARRVCYSVPAHCAHAHTVHDEKALVHLLKRLR